MSLRELLDGLGREGVSDSGVNSMVEVLFRKILLAYDGSEQAFNAFKLALAIATQTGGEIHIVSVGEVDYIPQFVEDVREQKGVAVHRLRSFLFRARALTSQSNVKLHSHILVGHPVRAIVRLARELNADLLVIGAKGHSALYERVVGSRASQIMQVARCPVLVVKDNRRRRRVKRTFGLGISWNEIQIKSLDSSAA
jgi:nucleotide-binding universal stress UspA family protein